MKFATFIAPGESDPQAGEVRGDEIVAFSSGTVLERLQSGDRTPAGGATHELAAVTLLEPVPRPPAIFCIGRNYAAHIAELGSEKPEKPLVFLKLPLSSVPPSGPVKRPKASNALDYEVELVLVMGPDNTIAGYAVANDVSARDLQRSEAQWSRAKGFDSSCPWGPWITTTDEIDAANLRLTTHVNGELRQDGSTSDLIFKPQELVDFIAEACTLEPGAIILTGTPSGVGEAFKPPKYLQDGDVVKVEVEGLGALEHSITT
ncbi:fumarylacetoacetate hydrolase family protein [Solirubrobacter ginsenosidimutans]|uniref:Fumarylacetoacetate hydrolase family protein n=1 Tax=Solirubrobacter ginsenosidimutans TaxID=490573 RepID=A0A9X3S5P8_9ACTN|nr:fumarylacetoacetate hydrolase family protein [Solirubrobacter ginsenosidimutans]MDA0167024.1 fumarylacetoacetate hydrolase family protein [Solirubrobacter ginsenosidimutans]